MFERRKNPRNRTLLSGEVAYHPHYSPFRCVVRNLSDAGANLAFSASMVIPAEIDLRVAHRAQTRRARVVWRRGDAAGVAFIEPEAASAPIPLALARRLRDGEAANRALRERLAALGDPA